ncbi:MAG: hypothetical protein JSV34_03935 [Candidatus Omnitrophota bacterium]|nr:MAG: hypothetical protein JSV34_03935 [Candidatus Omnitrophota bacterium]
MKKKELFSKLNILTDFEKNIVSLIDKQPKSFKKQTVLEKIKSIKRTHKKHIKVLDEIIDRIKRGKRRVY